MRFGCHSDTDYFALPPHTAGPPLVKALMQSSDSSPQVTLSPALFLLQIAPLANIN